MSLSRKGRTEGPAAWLARHRLRLAGAVVLVCALAFGWYLLFGPISPHGVVLATVSALERGDARRLCALANPGELRRLNLNPDNVAQFLRGTLWKNGYPNIVGEQFIKLPNPPDQQDWALRFTGSPGSTPDSSTVNVDVLQDQHTGWHLCLSRLLSCSLWAPWMPPEARHSYVSRAQPLGITGGMDSAGVYYAIKGSELEPAHPAVTSE